MCKNHFDPWRDLYFMYEVLELNLAKKGEEKGDEMRRMGWRKKSV